VVFYFQIGRAYLSIYVNKKAASGAQHS